METLVTTAKTKAGRVQTGVRIEKRILQVLKAIAAKHDFGVSGLIEGIVLHSFEDKTPFGTESLTIIDQMLAAYGLDLTEQIAISYRKIKL